MMKKYFYMAIGSVAALIVAAAIVISNPALAQDYVFLPFFGIGEGVDGASLEVEVKEFVENPPWTEEDAKEVERELKENPLPDDSRDVVIPAAGVATKGSFALVPGMGFIKLPEGAYVGSTDMIEGCNLEDKSQCIEGMWLTTIKQDGVSGELWLVDGKLYEEGEKRVSNAAFAEVIEAIRKPVEMDTNTGLPIGFTEGK